MKLFFSVIIDHQNTIAHFLSARVDSEVEKDYRVLLVEGIHPIALDVLRSANIEVDLINHSPSEAELLTLVSKYNILGIRSKTQLSEDFLKKANHLISIGAFCIGTNQIDLDAANEIGIPVFNAPYSNTRSVAELVLAEMVMLARQLGDKNSLAHQGKWLKSADGSHEIRGKTLGIVGYGHIGSQVSILAEAFGLRVLYFDIVKKLPLGNAQAVSTLDQLLEESDFISLHVPETESTKDLIGSAELRAMKKGSYLINASRGTVVDIEALAGALKSKAIAGCAIDVFPEEPASNKDLFKSQLQGLENVILTPHIGGSTLEAQHAIGIEVAESFIRFIKNGMTSGAVNFPNIDPSPLVRGRRIVNIHRNEPGVLSEVNGIISKHGGNILAQYLSTDAKVGYLVTDVELQNVDQLVSEISKSSRNMRTRLIS